MIGELLRLTNQAGEKSYKRNKMMRLRCARILASGILLAAASFCWSQEQQHAIVVKAARHAVAPPLSQVAPIPPGGSAESEGHLSLRGPVSAAENRNEDLPQSENTSLAAFTALSTNPGLNILGIGAGFAGYTTQASVPDTSIAVGPTQIVQFVNESFAVFDKPTGTVLLGPANGDTLWQSLGGSCFGTPHLDEIAQFDKLANRWVMMMPTLGASPPYLCVAVSQTSDAVTGGWNLYAFKILASPACGNNTCGPDYPKLAVWPDAYYVSYNESASASSVFAGDAVCALDRNSMLANSTATMQCFMDVGTTYGNLLPADLDGINPPPTGTPEYFLDFDTSHNLDLWQFHVDWTTPANSTFGSTTTSPWAPNNTISVPSFTEPCGETAVQITYQTGDCIPQSNKNQPLDSYGDRLMYRLAYRNLGSHQSLVANHSIQTGGSGSQTGIRWYELQDTGSGFSLSQSGTYSPDSEFRWMGSIAMDQSGDIALGYSVSGSDMAPSIRYTGHLATDPAGQMDGEVDILSQANPAITPAPQGGTGSSFHWSDYATMAIDPVDDCTFWFAAEYIPSTGSKWATRIASFSFPSCSGPTLAVSLSGKGSGTVTSSPAGISCPSGACSSAFVSGTAVTLSAAPASGSIFSGWNGACSGTSTCSLAVAGPESVGASFVLQDFTVTPAPLAKTVSAGGSATYAVAIAAVQGFSSAVTLGCSAPAAQGITCSMNPGSVMPGNSANLVVTTTAPTAALMFAPRGGRRAAFATWLLFPALAFVGIVPIGLRSKRRRLAGLLLSMALSGVIALQSACGGGNSSGGGQSGGTPAGTYTVNITATSGSLSHPTSVTITVQ